MPKLFLKERIMKKALKKVMALLLACITLLGAFGCGPKKVPRRGDTVYLDVMYFDGGFGSAWLEKAANEFAKCNKPLLLQIGTPIIK